jgi:pimeloyl-ACP methyl ester carboxylesterase
VLLVHGGASPKTTWAGLEPLRERWTLGYVHRRGYPPSPSTDRQDFDVDADDLLPLLGGRPHLVMHSYGSLGALSAAARVPDQVRSLTVIEPPAFGLAPGRPGVDEFVAAAEALWEAGPRDPGAFLRSFLAAVGSALPPGDFSPALLQGARTLMVERYPWTARPPLDEITAPTLVVSGAHSEPFDAVCDVLEERLGAQRAVLRGAGHAVPRLGAPFNDVLESFVTRS